MSIFISDLYENGRLDREMEFVLRIRRLEEEGFKSDSEVHRKATARKKLTKVRV